MDDDFLDIGPDTTGADMSWVFVLFGILFVAVVIFIIVTFVRNWNVAKKAGYDPLAMETQIAAQVGRSALLRPGRCRDGASVYRAAADGAG